MATKTANLHNSDRPLGDSMPRQEVGGIQTGTFIDLHKALVIPLVLAMMWYYHNWSTDAFVYLGMHGSYSLLWLIKQRTYRDARFDQRLPLWVGLRAYAPDFSGFSATTVDFSGIWASTSKR